MHRRDSKQERAREFIAEAEDILASMGKGLVKLGRGVKAGVIDPAVLNDIFRSAHSLKGMAGIYEFKDLAGLSHSLEDALDSLRLGKTALDDEVFSALMGAYELLTRIASAKGKPSFAREIETAKTRLSLAPHSRLQPEIRLAKELEASLTEYEDYRLRENIREEKNVFIINCNFPISSFDVDYPVLTEFLKTRAELIATLPSPQTTHDRLYFDVLIGTRDDLSAITAHLGGRYESVVRRLNDKEMFAASSDRGKASVPAAVHRDTLRRSASTVRVNIAKLDKIMNLIGELGILKSNLTSLGVALKGAKDLSVYGIELARTEKGLERKLNELRTSVIDIRMVPIGQLFSRFETFLDRLGRESGKEVRMVTDGEETELDKLIIEELADPFMHIIRNAVDHALETPVEREAAGKTPYGVITLSAYQKGNHVVVEVKDDGRGIDDSLVREKAASRGIAPRDYLNGLSRQEAIELIFMPGFSTRDTVNETSGRGVGMDVVRENITRLSGMIDVDTVKGKGTRIILTIPITLAIMPTLIVESAGTRYAVPLSSVIEILELRPAVAACALHDGFIDAGGIRTPVARLSEFIGKTSVNRDVVYGIVAGLAEHRLCLIVDKVVEELDVIVKPLSGLLKAPGIAGAADMGEKGTVLVLDLTGILEEMSVRSKHHINA